MDNLVKIEDLIRKVFNIEEDDHDFSLSHQNATIEKKAANREHFLNNVSVNIILTPKKNQQTPIKIEGNTETAVDYTPLAKVVDCTSFAK